MNYEKVTIRQSRKKLSIITCATGSALNQNPGEPPRHGSRGNRPLQRTFAGQPHALIFFHLEEHVSGWSPVQSLKENDFARMSIAPEKGNAKSSFFEAMNAGGLEQFLAWWK